MIKRAIKIKMKDEEKVLELSKATSVRTKKNMIYLDELDDGTWRLIYNENMIKDFSKVLSLDVIREDT